jgi:hypothetical protein
MKQKYPPLLPIGVFISKGRAGVVFKVRLLPYHQPKSMAYRIRPPHVID